MILGTRLTEDLSQHLPFPTDRWCWQPLTLYVTADTQPGFSYAWIVTRHICFEISRRGSSYSNQYWTEGSIYCTILHGKEEGLKHYYNVTKKVSPCFEIFKSPQQLKVLKHYLFSIINTIRSFRGCFDYPFRLLYVASRHDICPKFYTARFSG